MKTKIFICILFHMSSIILFLSCNKSGVITSFQPLPSGDIYFSKFKPTTIGFETYIISPDGSNRILITELGIITATPYSNKMTIGKVDSLFFYNKLYVMNIDGTNLVEIPRNNYYPVYFILSPDANKVLFTTDAGNYLCVANSDGSNLIQISSSLSGFEGTPKFSPDSKRIAFLEFIPSVMTFLSVVNTDGTNLVRIKDSVYNYSQSTLNWSPDGNKIAFCTDSAATGKSSIYVINIDGTGYTKLSKTNQRDKDPEWSPDGTKIVFTTYESSGVTDIALMNSDGSGNKNLTNTPNVHEVFPHWSPDGSKVIFASHYGGNSSLSVFDINTEVSINIADSIASSFAFWNFSN